MLQSLEVVNNSQQPLMVWEEEEQAMVKAQLHQKEAIQVVQQHPQQGQECPLAQVHWEVA